MSQQISQRPLVGVDWGTSALRVARLGADGRALEERSMPRGILTVAQGEFPAVFESACGVWMSEPGSLALICGMAGSRQGWLEAPYCPCPAGFADIARQLAWVMPGRVAIVPGLSCEQRGIPDVMRGEETKVFGALELLGKDDALLALPGTHSKWARVRARRVENFSTFMTGEFYSLLRKHSILARTLPTQDGDLHEESFKRGVDHAMQSGTLLHSAFSARTLLLFDRLSESEATNYLSGMVIGEELRSHDLHEVAEPIILVGSETLRPRYELALHHLGAPVTTLGEEAVWSGLRAIAQTLEAAP
jgi:2-dehydro-3-deoxygalactonokinase